ncbi:MAG: DMT family transporter [Clostridiales bacterium]|nr:DMT family transporter [Clostridiales bacterium]
MIKANKQHTIGLILLTLTAMFWGAGFVLNDQLLTVAFFNTPSLLNALRFCIAALCLLAVFNKKIKFNKQILLYGGLGGVMLFAGFLSQTIGLKYTTPSHSGFFTASYVMFVPFIAWIAYRKRPRWISFVGVAVAIVGLVVLNFKNDEVGAEKTWIGDLLTIFCALMFALQIFWTDYTLKKDKVDFVQMTFWQVAVAGVLFVLYSAIFESKYYTSMSIDMGYCWWRLLIVIFGGTAFAYYAQTFAQKHLNAMETSLIMACESPIGAFLSMVLLIEPFSWQTVVGGVLVIAAVILVEVIPAINNKKHNTNSE